jgi:hypothetical protein
MNKIYLLLPFLIFSQFNIYSQQNQVVQSNKNELIVEVLEDGKIEDGKYKCNLFNWQIEIPSDFTITSQESIKQLEDKGYAAMQENATEGKNIRRETNNLIGFEKDKYNTFGVTYESLEGTKKLSLEEHKNFIVKLLEETYTGKGVKFDIAKSDLKLGKHIFYKILVHIYHPKTDQLILTQEFYTAYINNHLFSANINYRDENLGYILSYNFVKSFQ